MGRKIPGRKHRGVKLPEQQRAERFERIKDKINCPPVDIEAQEIPKSCLRIKELIDKTKGGSRILNKKKNFSEHKGVKLPTDMPAFKKMHKESDREYKRRLFHVVEGVKRETAFEIKYNVEVTRNAKTGKPEGLVKRKPDPLEAYIKEAREKKRGKKSKEVEKKNVPKLSKYQKRKEKLKGKKDSKIDLNKDEFKSFTDSVKFGEVVHCPPTLAAIKKGGKSEMERPGKRQLLLKSLLDKSDKNPKEVSIKTLKNEKRGTIHKTIDKKGKRKLLPPLLRMQLERDQVNIVKQYKMIKKQKNV